MMDVQSQTFDLTQRRPQVLLVGNGLCRQNGYSWNEFIKSCARDGADINKYGGELPNTMLTLVAMDCDDTIRHQRYMDKLKAIRYDQNPYISKLIQLPADDILTTNYTYEIESAINSNYPCLKDKAKREYSRAVKPDAKYLIHTCNTFDGYPPIWHIHGEIRRKSSLILSYDEYARVTNEIIEYCKKRGNDYVEYGQDIHIKSWIDLFITGDLYILGFGLDFSEFDLWWLINRRIREKASVGEIYFYEPETAKNSIKLAAMDDVGISVKTLGIKIDENGDLSRQYDDFYNRAIDDISKMISKSLPR